jgi:acetyl-CoA acetyltransferase
MRPLARIVTTRRCRCRSIADGDRSHPGHSQGAAAAGLTIDDIDLIELNEAFAAQGWRA